jgi:hypothetical protein
MNAEHAGDVEVLVRETPWVFRFGFSSIYDYII